MIKKLAVIIAMIPLFNAQAFELVEEYPQGIKMSPMIREGLKKQKSEFWKFAIKFNLLKNGKLDNHMVTHFCRINRLMHPSDAEFYYAVKFDTAYVRDGKIYHSIGILCDRGNTTRQ